jgi:hypothetical protein
MRGTEKTDAQWKMYCIVHNIGKCIRALRKKLGALGKKWGKFMLLKIKTNKILRMI